MPFAALEDGFHDSPKILAAGNAAVGVYARALSYCVDHLTDGFVPSMWAKANAKPAELKALTDTGLWVSVKSGATFDVETRQGGNVTVEIRGVGYFIRDYAKYNDTKAFVEKRREEKREAGRKGAKARWPKSTTDSTTDSTCHSSSDGSSDDVGMSAGMPPVPVPVPNELQPGSIQKEVRGGAGDGDVEDDVAQARLDTLISAVAASTRMPWETDDDIPF